ncbi:MAG: hypothetical protein RXQ75_09860 [Acidianus hospitalis]
MNEKITVILTLRMQKVPTPEELNRSFYKLFHIKASFKEEPLPSTEEVKKAFYTFINSDLADYMKKYAINNDVITFYTDTEFYIERFNELFNSKQFMIEVKGSIIILKYVLDNENKIGARLLLHRDIIDPGHEAQLLADFDNIRFIASVIAEAIRKYISRDISVSNNFLVKIKEGDLPDNDVKELVEQIPKEGGFAVAREGKELRKIPGIPFYRLSIRGNHVTYYVFGFWRGFPWYGDPTEEKIHEIVEKLRPIMRERGYIKYV